MGASRRKRIWVGGMVPVGYLSRDKKLFLEEDEAVRVHTIFRRYLELGSLGQLSRERASSARAAAILDY
jgi:site-specific DNA recombinase